MRLPVLPLFAIALLSGCSTLPNRSASTEVLDRCLPSMTAEVPKKIGPPESARFSPASTPYLVGYLLPTFVALIERAEETKKWCEERSKSTGSTSPSG